MVKRLAADVRGRQTSARKLLSVTGERKLVTRHYGAVTTFVTVLVSGAAPASHLGGVRFWGWRLRPCSHTGEKPLCVKGDL